MEVKMKKLLLGLLSLLFNLSAMDEGLTTRLAAMDVELAERLRSSIAQSEKDALPSSERLRSAYELKEKAACYDREGLLNPQFMPINIAQLREKRRKSQEAFFAKLQFIASFLKKQAELMENAKSYIEALDTYASYHNLFEQRYSNIGIITESRAGRTGCFTANASPESISAFLCLNRAEKENKEPEEKIEFINKLSKESSDQSLQAALLWKKSCYQSELRDTKMGLISEIISQIPPEAVLEYLPDTPGYGYPYCQLFNLLCNYTFALELQKVKGTFCDTNFNDEDIDVRNRIEQTVKHYKTHQNNFEKIYDDLVDYLKENCHKNYLTYRKDFFTGEILSPKKTPSDADKTSCTDRSAIVIELIKLERESKKTASSPRTSKKKKSRGKNSPNQKNHAESHEESLIDESSAASSTTQISTSTQSASPHPYERSTPMFIRFAHRVLIWHKDAQTALNEQGYTQSERDSEVLQTMIIRHRIPFNIEQYFRHLAIETHTKKDSKILHTLNFPGAIEIPGKGMMTGIFAIGFNPDKNNEIYHRFFHLKTEEELQNAVAQGIYALEITPQRDDEEILIEAPETGEYIIQEDALTVKITDNFGITYILFKGHKI